MIKDIQDYGRNKDKHSLTTTINISYIIGDMLGEKEVSKATNSNQDGNLIDKETTPTQYEGRNAYQSESSFKEYTRIDYSFDTLYENHLIM